MKFLLLTSSVVLSVVMVGCVKPKSVAAEYKAKMAAGESDAAPAGDGEVAPEGDGGGEGDTPPEGDVEKGNTLLKTCAGCHPASAKVDLNADAVSRLDDAFTGAQTKTHGTMTEAFETGRADLEAALNAIPGKAALKLTAPVKAKAKVEVKPKK